jgi:hypothetical protein
MRNAVTGSLVVAAVLAFSVVGMAQGQGRQNVPGGAGEDLGAKSLERFGVSAKDTGGPAPKQSLTGAWAGPQEAKIAAAPPMTPAGLKMFASHHTEAKYSAASTNDPWYNTCDAMGFPRSSLNEIRAVMFAQMPDRLVEVYQYSRLWREIMTNGEPLPKDVGQPGGSDPRWYGYSVGHWDGDNTLVVDTTGSDDRSWLDKEGHPHSVNAMIHETYERSSHNLMTNTVTITDPEMYTMPYPISKIQWIWIPNQKFEEQLCVPSEMIAYRALVGSPAGDGGLGAKK